MGRSNFDSVYASGLVYSLGVPVLPGLGSSVPESVYFVRSQGSSAAFPDSYSTLQSAITHANTNAVKRPVFILLDDIREEVTIPNTLADGTIVGSGTRPRHGDSGTNPFGPDTASWRNSSGVTTTALCIVKAQGWRFVNLLMDAPTTAACVELFRDNGSGADENDASHASFYGVRFAGGETGIEQTGTENVFNVAVSGCTFHDLTDGIKGNNAYRWQITDNYFLDNTNHIDVAAVESRITDNVFGLANTKGVDLTGGSNNVVSRNAFHGDYNVLNTGGTSDMWAGNFAEETGGVTDADPTGS